MPNVLLDGCLMIILTFSRSLQVCATECFPAVEANRSTLFVPEGGSISLKCKVHHCGQKSWTGGWGLTTGGHFTLLSPSPRFHLSNHSISAKSTLLLINIQNLNQSDSGAYQCSIKWMGGDATTVISSNGHVTYVNVTTGSYVHITESVYRKVSHRLLVCAGASLCFPLVLGLACCLSSKRHRAPPVPPHFRSTSAARVKPQAEVVYAAVVLKSPKQQKIPQESEPTVYTSLKFSSA